MSIFKGYEVKVLRLLAASVLSPWQIEALVHEGQLVRYDYTGNGYFLFVSHESLPTERIVCSEPIVTGSVDGITCGFIIFIENGQLMIECHSWGEVEVPIGFREMNVQITTT